MAETGEGGGKGRGGEGGEGGGYGDNGDHGNGQSQEAQQKLLKNLVSSNPGVFKTYSEEALQAFIRSAVSQSTSEKELQEKIRAQ